MDVENEKTGDEIRFSSSSKHRHVPRSPLETGRIPFRAKNTGFQTPNGTRRPGDHGTSTPKFGLEALREERGRWAQGMHGRTPVASPFRLMQDSAKSDNRSLCIGNSPLERVPVAHFDLGRSIDSADGDNVQVAVRIRPLNSKELATVGGKRCVLQNSAQSLEYVSSVEKLGYKFDNVAGEGVSQAELFTATGLPMVENCLAGYNSTIFAYGQTGSGKTHTMFGDIGTSTTLSRSQRGIIPRVFEHMMDRIEEEKSARSGESLQYSCTCSFLEIYNEHIRDLLDPTKQNLQIREDAKRGQYVEDLTAIAVETAHDVLQLLQQGAANRRVGATNMNQESSRSHSVFTCTVESTYVKDSVVNHRYGRLNLVDLAGSERQKSSGATGDRLREASSINKSLTHLGHVIMVLVEMGKEKKDRHVPYRDSKLTYLLQDSLGGNSKTTLIANISPSFMTHSETLSTLKFASRAKYLRNKAVVNEGTTGNRAALRDEIRRLKDEVSRLRTHPTKSPNLRGRLSLAGVHSSPGTQLHISKIKALQSVLHGALRREQHAEEEMKSLSTQIAHLKRLVQGRDNDIQSYRMLLRFRDERIQKMQAGGDGSEEVDAEMKMLEEENKVLMERVERNPKMTRLAVENMFLGEQLRNVQSQTQTDDRAVMKEEICGLRKQLLESLDGASVVNEQGEAPAQAKLVAQMEADFCAKEEAWQVQVDELQSRVQQMELEGVPNALNPALGEADVEMQDGSRRASEASDALESLRSQVVEEMGSHEVREAELIEEIETLKGEVERERELSSAASDTAETEWLRRSAAERDLQSVKRELEQVYNQVQQMQSIQESQDYPPKDLVVELEEQAALTEEFRSQLDQTVECLQEVKEENVCLRRLSFLPDTEDKEVVLKERILELERLAEQRQAEVASLNTRFMASEAMTHDLLAQANRATILDQKLERMGVELGSLVKEQQRWRGEREQREREADALNEVLEGKEEQQQILREENERLKLSTASLQEHLSVVEGEMKKLAGQQNAKQRIQHHEKIKEENSALRLQSEELSCRLKKSEAAVARLTHEVEQLQASLAKDSRFDALKADPENKVQGQQAPTEE